MSVSRREFMGIISATALATSTVGSACRNGTIESVANITKQSPTGSDPLNVRGDFPVVNETVFLNTPYISPTPTPAINATNQFLMAKARDPLLLGDMLAETKAVREKFAKMVHADPGEIGVVSSTSEGENIVANSMNLQAGDNVVIDDLHYTTSLVLYSQLAESTGVEIRIVRNKDGVADTESFAEMVDDKTKLISVAWVSNRNGYRHDLESLATLAHAHGSYLYVDAIQGVGMLNLDIKKSGVDFLTAGSYKWLLGGFGIAPFYVREDVMDIIRPDRYGWRMVQDRLSENQYQIFSDARKFGYATPAFGAVYQLSASLDYLLQVGVKYIENHTVPLANRLQAALAKQGFQVLTPPDNMSAIVAFKHGADYEKISKQIDEAGLRLSFRENNEQIRVGIALFNNMEDVDIFLDITEGWTKTF